MEATAETTQAATHKQFKSPARVLVTFFQRSRDRWKQKYQDLKATVKAYKVRIADLSKSREQWRLKAEQAGEQLSAREAEIKALRTQIAGWEKKKGTNPWGR